MDNQTAHNNQ